MTGLHEHREVSDAMERREIFFYLIKPVDVERLLREMSNAMDDFFVAATVLSAKRVAAY